VECWTVVWLHAVAEVEIGEGVIELPGLVQQDACLAGGISVACVAPHGFTKTTERITAALAPDQRVAEIAPSFCAVRVKLHRPIEQLQRVGLSALLQEQSAKAAQIMRTWFAPDRA